MMISMMNYHTFNMTAAKIAITLDEDLLKEVDRWVEQKLYPNRSQAVQSALSTQLALVNRQRLEAECEKLNPLEEQDFAELGMETVMNDWALY
jgi:Arc/MetJ-type ribon-helix-helix transcriptional regulator